MMNMTWEEGIKEHGRRIREIPVKVEPTRIHNPEGLGLAFNIKTVAKELEQIDMKAIFEASNPSDKEVQLG